MTEAKEKSSLPLLLSITSAILAVAVGGWFLLYQETSAPTASPDTSTTTPVASTASGTDDAVSENAETPVENESETDVATLPDAEASDVDAELRKARLAADADILVFPQAQSALYYYGRVLNIDPQHAIASAELDTILVSVGQTVKQYLNAERFEDAYEIATLVAKQRPEHALVIETQQTLDKHTEQLVAQAMQHAQDGDDGQAVQVLATAEALPGRNPDYFNAIRESVADIQNVRLDAERDRTQRAQLAESEARAAWVDRIQQAIAEGNLISPAGASARDLLAERNSWVAERNRLTTEVQSALMSTAQSHIDAERLDEAGVLLNATVDLGGEADGLEALRSSFERALIDAESTRVAHMSELVKLKTAQPRYPRRALERSVTGWVDVYFTVTPSGETADIEVYQSEPRTVFDRAAINAVEDWAFQPVEYRGQVISRRAATRLVFRLE